MEKYLFSNENFSGQSHLTSFDPSKIGSAKIIKKKRPNSAKMLNELCVINDDVTYCLIEKNLVKQSCGEVSV